MLLAVESVKPDSEDCYGRTLLWWAAAAGREAAVDLLLTKHNVDPDSRDNFGRTPLSRAAKNGFPNIVKILLEKCKRNGIVIHDKNLTIATPPAAGWSLIVCDICWSRILDEDIFYHCRICGDGHFDLCYECIEIGAFCQNSSHKLVKVAIEGSTMRAID